jgi:hypothetical protein
MNCEENEEGDEDSVHVEDFECGCWDCHYENDWRKGLSKMEVDKTTAVVCLM